MSTAAPRDYTSPYRLFGAIAAIAAIAIVLLLAVWLGLHWYVAWLAGWSVVTFIFYGYDKMQSQRDGGRVPELVLHGMALIGGFPGGWAGRAVFRHKTRHGSFTAVLVLATVIHAVFAFWVLL